MSPFVNLEAHLKSPKVSTKFKRYARTLYHGLEFHNGFFCLRHQASRANATQLKKEKLTVPITVNTLNSHKFELTLSAQNQGTEHVMTSKTRNNDSPL
jgi:hypothetical protein